MSEKFCENLKNARLDRGITQVELASLLGVAKSTYSMYESGKREPNIQMIKKIADILDVSVSELLGWNEKENDDILKVTDPTMHSAFSKMAESNTVSLFSGSNKILYDILNEMLKEEEKEELNRRLREKLPTGNYKISDVAAHFGNDEYTKEEMQKIEEFAQFIKSQRK